MRKSYFIFSLVLVMCSAVISGSFFGDLFSLKFLVLPGFLFPIALMFPARKLVGSDWRSIAHFVMTAYLIWSALLFVSIGFLTPVQLFVSPSFGYPIIGAVGALTTALFYYRLIIKKEPSWGILGLFCGFGYVGMFSSYLFPSQSGSELGFLTDIFFWQLLIGASLNVVLFKNLDIPNTPTSS
ncbi:MAG: hypothetical protein ABWZ25_18130 [Chitinophagaceae bacterium]